MKSVFTFTNRKSAQQMGRDINRYAMIPFNSTTGIKWKTRPVAGGMFDLIVEHPEGTSFNCDCGHRLYWISGHKSELNCSFCLRP